MFFWAAQFSNLYVLNKGLLLQDWVFRLGSRPNKYMTNLKNIDCLNWGLFSKYVDMIRWPSQGSIICLLLSTFRLKNKDCRGRYLGSQKRAKNVHAISSYCRIQRNATELLGLFLKSPFQFSNQEKWDNYQTKFL